MSKALFLFVLCCFTVGLTVAQEEQKTDSLRQKKTDAVQTDLKKKGVVVEDVVLKTPEETNPLAPSKAAFFSAVLPGLGQIYNKRYWKVPIVYAAIGSGYLVYDFNNRQYNLARDAFKRRQAGFTDDMFFGSDPNNPLLSDTALEDRQERFQRDRDLALLVTIALYALNIIDANVDAHLKQYNVDDNLSMDFQPYLDVNPVTSNPYYGMALTIKF